MHHSGFRKESLLIKRLSRAQAFIGNQTSMKKDPTVEVRHSKIHGRGLFATRIFKKGEVVISWHAEELTVAEYDALPRGEKKYVAHIREQLFLLPAPVRYMNHSCEPNTMTIKTGVDVAKRDIEAGEELTANYLALKDSFTTTVRVCSCGGLSCKKQISNQ